VFIFGHLGIGSKLVSPLTRGLTRRWVLLGTLVPDLIDKPLYYILSWSTGLRGADLGLISGTRTFGHTALLLLILSIITFFTRARALAALALGMGSHLLLDAISDRFSHAQLPQAGPKSALLWPFIQDRFPFYPFESMGQHLSIWGKPFVLGAEIVGILILAWDFWRTRHESEILTYLSKRRHERRERRKQKVQGTIGWK